MEAMVSLFQDSLGLREAGLECWAIRATPTLTLALTPNLTPALASTKMDELADLQVPQLGVS